MNRAAVICFALTAVGIPLYIYLMLTEQPPATIFGYFYVFAALPTTPVGNCGGIGAMRGQLKNGLVVGVLAFLFLAFFGITLSIAGIN